MSELETINIVDKTTKWQKFLQLIGFQRRISDWTHKIEDVVVEEITYDEGLFK